MSDTDSFKKPSSIGPESEHLRFKIHNKRIADAATIKFDSNEKPTIKAEEITPIVKAQEDPILVAEQTFVDLPYKVPVWSSICPPDSDYCLEVLKNGCIIDKMDIRQKPFYVFGRQKDCDFQLEHPSISRYHAVLQYRGLGDAKRDEIGWYMYDTGSTHGTVVNKQKLPPHMHIRVKVGYVFKLGGSSRLFILQGPDEDAEEESSLTVTEIKQKAAKQKLIMDLAKTAKLQVLESTLAKRDDDNNESDVTESNKEEAGGIDWGMGFDTYGRGDEEDEEEENEGESIDFEDIEKREQFYIDDPKKALKNFFDRQACDLKYEYEEKGSSFNRKWNCRVELPVETSTGRTIYADVTVSGGKKEASAACALEACRMLDAYGVLRKSHQDSKKPKTKNLTENDYYDSDEDTFFDRTGQLEKKRHSRIVRSSNEKNDTSSSSHGGKSTTANTVDNYETLQAKLADVDSEIRRVKQQLELLNAELHEKSAPSQESSTTSSNNSGRDSLDDYMMRMSRVDAGQAKFKSSQLKLKLFDLSKAAQRLRKLVAIARPAMSKFRPPSTLAGGIQTGSMKRSAPKIDDVPAGKRTEETATGDSNKSSRTVVKTVVIGQQEVEIEEEEEVEGVSKTKADELMPEVTNPKNSAPVIIEPVCSREKASVDMLSVEQSSPENNTKSLGSVQPGTSSKKRKLEAKPKQEGNEKTIVDYEKMNDPNYAVWMPPENQSGDGRTSLNEKLGY